MQQLTTKKNNFLSLQLYIKFPGQKIENEIETNKNFQQLNRINKVSDSSLMEF
jgi:hypothetical protein